MLRLAIAAALLASAPSALAQTMDEVKGVKFGMGCGGPMSTFAAKLGTCAVDDTKSRIWCPNGKTFDRRGAGVVSSYVIRAICELNQVP
jgi:hypothetical protein